MKLPPFMLAAALALWAERSTQWPVAVAMALLAELPHWVPWRWQLARRDFDRVADASAIGFVLVAIYAFDEYAFHGVYSLIEWLPMLLCPLLLVQLYSTEDEIRYTSLFFTVRRAHARGLIGGDRGVDFRRPYLGACLLAATVNTEDGEHVFWLLLAIVAWLLWANRSPRYGTRAWLVALAVLTALAAGSAAGIIGVRRIVEPAAMAWLQDRIWSHRDPFRAYTAIGQIGRLKQSDAVVLRVTPEPGTGRVPTLLREAVYQTFSRNIWLAGNANFERISSDLEGTTWQFREREGDSSVVRIGVYLPRGRGMLPLPNGAWQMTALPAEEVERNPLGALRVTEGPDFAEFDAHYVDENRYDEPPTESDVRVPKDLQTLMTRVLSEMGANGLAPIPAALRIQQYFDQGFTYSVVLKRPTAVSNPIHGFLLETRSGHCEYFATATVMLLRAAGVPARYVSGYSVQEWNPIEERYIVRRRHAHSWVIAWLDGAWREIDTTPAVWVADEQAEASWWEPAYDWLSWLWFQYSRWRWQVETEEEGNDILWLVLPLSLFLAWRLRRATRVDQRRAAATVARPPSPGTDSELYLVERRLRAEGVTRGEGEPLAAWLARLNGEGRLANADLLLGEVVHLHYRYRFDPRGIAPADRERLRDGVRRWLDRHARGGGAGRARDGGTRSA